MTLSEKVYPVQMKFEKRFTTGIFAHMSYNGSLGFVDAESAKRFIEAVDGRDIKTNGDTYHYVTFILNGQVIRTSRHKE